MSRTTLLISCLFIQLAVLNAQALTAILYNAPGGDNGFETVQIEGAPGASLVGLWFLVLEGDGSGAGTVDQAVDLGSLSPNTIGTNGVFLIRDAVGGWTPSPPAGTNVAVFNFTPDIENGSNTFLLVDGFTGSVGDDLDTDNDGVLDATPWTSVLTAVANLDSNSEPEYATALGGTAVNLLGCSTFTDPGFIFFAGGVWNGTVPQTGPNGTLSYSATQTFDESCTDIGGIYGGGTIIFGEGGNFLPVEWAYFRGQRQPAGVRLNWGTVSETNHDYFEVERSQDGRLFTALDRVLGEEEGRNGSRDYQYLDQLAPAGPLFYRLRQVDVDGAFSYSSLVSVTGETIKEELSVFPNPSSGLINIDGLDASTATVQVLLFDQLGRQLFHQELEGGLSRYQLEVERALAGQLLTLVIWQDETEQRLRLLVH